jgi:endonuclease/exonuclease/phosphatase family metal-dependent hydrolase
VVGLIVLVLVAVLLALTARETLESEVAPRSAYTLVQMNLCLSGRAACFPRVRYPLGVRDATDVITNNRADVVTLVEVCRADVDEIAAKTGLHVRFAAVSSSHGVPISCVDPGGRGAYGIAVLTRARITGSVDRPYAAQGGIEQRHWLCVTTAEARVCATHLEIRGSERVDAVNDAQCFEFGQVLERFVGDLPVIVGGDMNRDDACAASGMWARTDGDAVQASGRQHVYATSDFEEPETRIVPMVYTDHDALIVTSRLRP